MTVVEEDKPKTEPPLVERWLAEQQQWQRTLLTYMDSMVKSDEFLTHLGNAMRGSLLAGKAYPTPPAAGAAAPENVTDDKLDQVLFALRQLEGQIHDLRLSIDELRAGQTQKSPRAKKTAIAKAKDEP